MCYVATLPICSYHSLASPYYIICTYLQEAMDDSTLPLAAGGGGLAEAAGENLTCVGATPFHERVKISNASNCCLPSRDQLAIETRKAGNFQVAIRETRIITILAEVSTNVKV
ncbi:hypothetical protein IV203_019079 [Nitzschia inconspicua]|uniref:Uncharacterized protein n=1 Tax=Nitzschia inconspicua TaxID=303405 RepID=A0A9K3LYH8_9STRA|nr:hypothetical protein IV203_019079 [Nitzschia inconspicua]